MRDRARGSGLQKTALIAALAVTMTGCYSHTIHAGGGAPNGPVVYDEWQHFWIGGLVGDSRVDLQRLCGGRDATVRVRQSFLNGLVAGLTGGIYVPTTVEVRCRNGRRGDIELDADDLERLRESLDR